MNKYSLGFGLGLGTIIISYYYYKKCLQNNKDLNKNEEKDYILKKEIDNIVNKPEPIVLHNMSIDDTDTDTDKKMIKDILDEILNKVERNFGDEENNSSNQWTLVE